MLARQHDPRHILNDALARYHDGFDPALIELPEAAVFPYLIPVQRGTGKNSRQTGRLLGRPAPSFVKHGRTVRYRLKDVLDWLANAERYGSTAEVTMAGRHFLDTNAKGVRA
jgi:hypothetical protein